MTTLHLGRSISRSPLRRGLLLIPLALIWFALSPTVRAVSPPPDGGYPNFNTAEGDNALFSLTTGSYNTANGNSALYSNIGGNSNTANGVVALYSNTSGSNNTAAGDGALFSNKTGSGNTANGFEALLSNTAGSNNTAIGYQALYTTTGSPHTAIGFRALYSNTTGHNNTAIGVDALHDNTSGHANIALGDFAGGNLTTGSDNIDIGNEGVAGEASTIRIGDSSQTRAFITGIHGATASGGAAVYVNSSGQLGTLTSSARFKQDIHSMDKASEAILALKPVIFRYKPELDPDGIPQFGLVAEEVEKVNPALVARDGQGEVYTVRYEAVNAMLLNEFLKEHRKVEEEDRKVQEQEATITRLKSTVAQHQKEIEALTTSLQKVSAQLELRKPAPQTLANNQ